MLVRQKQQQTSGQKKFTENVLRDRSQTKELQKIGCRVATIWECQTFDQQGLESIIEALIKNTC